MSPTSPAGVLCRFSAALVASPLHNRLLSLSGSDALGQSCPKTRLGRPSCYSFWPLEDNPRGSPLLNCFRDPQITPKMCLLEWCRREKLAQPVYETVSSWLYPALVQPMHSRCHCVPQPAHRSIWTPGRLAGARCCLLWAGCH